jgi:hypothetical protein
VRQLKKAPLKGGEIFGKWTVIGLDPKTPNKRTYFVCKCLCGDTNTVHYRDLLDKVSTGCRSCQKKLGPNTCRKGHNTGICGTGARGRCRLCAIEYSLLRLYGLSLEEYQALYTLQHGLCAICGKALSVNIAFSFGKETKDTRRAEVDHKHVPKKVKPQPPKRSLVRGLLCGGRYAGCNAKLGHVDNVAWLQAAAQYLSKPPAQLLLQEREK